MKSGIQILLLILLPLLCQGLEQINSRPVEKPICNDEIRQKYCDAWYGGDLHTACKYCGIGPQCPEGVAVSGRGLRKRIDLKEEILRRHNEYRADVRAGRTGLPATKCIPDLKWDDELAEVAQIWADQCANVVYFHNSDIYPRIFHERGFERTTSRFNSPPGVGQNVAWALTKNVNFTRIIDDLWYRDINKLRPGRIDDFQVDTTRMDTNLVTQIIWGRTTHVGCGWTQFPLLEGSSKFKGIFAEGEYENFFVCNYGVGGNVPGEPVYEMDCQDNDNTDENDDEKMMQMLNHMEIKFRERFTQATPKAKHEINICLDTLACMSQQSSARKSCSQLEIQCVIDISPKFTDTEAYFHSNSVAARISQLECKIEALLCQLPGRQPKSNNDSLSTVLKMNVKRLEYLEVLKSGNLLHKLSIEQHCRKGIKFKVSLVKASKISGSEKTGACNSITVDTLINNEGGMDSGKTNSCRTNLEKCIQDAKLNSEVLMPDSLPSSTSPAPTSRIPFSPVASSPISDVTTPISTTTTEQIETTTKKVVILVSTTTRPAVIQTTFASSEPTSTNRPTLMSGSTSIDIDETTTKVPKLDIQVTTVKPADINRILSETTLVSNATVTTPASTTLLTRVPLTSLNPDRRLTTTAKTGLFEETGFTTAATTLLAREGDIPLDGLRSTSERNPLINDNKFNQPRDEVLQKPSIDNVQLDNNETEEIIEKTTMKSMTTNARPPPTLSMTQTSSIIGVPSSTSMRSLIDFKNRDGANEDKLVPQSTTKTFTSTLEDLQQKIEDQTRKVNPTTAFTEKITTEREESFFGGAQKPTLMSSTESSLKKTTKTVDEIEPDAKTTTMRTNLLDFLAAFPDTTTTRNLAPSVPIEQTPISGVSISLEDLMDMLRNKSSDIEIRQETDFNISFYNSTSKTSFRLAVCLDGIRCEDTARCKLVHNKCNEGLDVSQLPHRVRQKLSECSVDDILCHLNANPDIYECQRVYERCIKIVVPSEYIPMIVASELSPAALPTTATISTTELEQIPPTLDPEMNGIYDLDSSFIAVSILGGLASMTDKTSDVLNELTSNVLSAIQNSTNGYEIHPLTGNFTIAELLENDDTIPIFQDFIILLNDAQNLNDTAIRGSSNDQDPSFGVNLTNATVVFNPSTFTIGDVKTKLDPKLNETLRENIIAAVKDFAKVCTICNSTTSVDEELKDPKVLLALCLKGVECDESKTCSKAQILCLGELQYNNYNHEQRKSLSECYVDHYICTLNSTRNCEPRLENCLETKAEEFTKNSITVEDIISQVADDISEIVTDENDIDGLFDVSQKIIISGINEFDESMPSSNEGTVSINLNDTKGPIILSSSTPIIKFNEENPTIIVSVAEQELQGKEPEERKKITKARIEEALRQIVVTSSQNHIPEPQIPDDDSIAGIIANTVSDFLKESKEEIPDNIVIHLETETDLDVPEIEIGHNEDDGTLVTTVKLPGAQEQSIQFPVPVPKSADKTTINVDSFAEVISTTFDNLLATSTTSKPLVSTTPSLSDKLEESVSISQIISQTVDAYVKESKEGAPNQLLVGIETITDSTNPQIQVEPTSTKDTLKAVVKLPGEVEQSIEFVVPVQKLPNGESINIEDLADGISKTFDETIEKSSGIGVPEKSVPEIIANIVSSYVEQSQEEIPKNLLVDIEPKGNLKNPEIQVQPTQKKDDLRATVHLPSKETGQSINFKVPVPKPPNTESMIDEIGLAKIISKTYDETVSKTIIDNLMDQQTNNEAKLPDIIANAVQGYVESSGNVTPDDIVILIATSPISTNPEIQVQPTGTGSLKTTVIVPGPVGSPVEFQVSLPESLTKPDFDVENLANLISKTYEEMVHSNQSTVPKNISDAIFDYVKESKTVIPDDVHVMIETIKDLRIPDPGIIIESGTNKNSLDAKVRLPGVIDNNVDFHVSIPKSSDNEDSIDRVALTEIISKKYKEARFPSPTSAFLDKIENKEIDKISLADVIANTVAAYVEQDQNNPPPKDLGVKVETNQDLKNPEIEVKPSEKETTLITAVKLPGSQDLNVKFEVPVSLTPNQASIDVKQLVKEVSNGFDDAISSTSRPTLPSTNEEISQMVAKSVTDHLEQNKVEDADNVTLIIAPNTEISKPKIKVEGIDNVKVSVQIPDTENESIGETIKQIYLPKVQGSDAINVQQLSFDVKEVLDQSEKPETSSEIATIMATVVSGLIIDENEGSLPSDIQLQVNFNENKNVAEVESVTSKDGMVEAIITVPGDRNEPSRVINIPTVGGNSSNINKDNLINDLSEKIEPLLKPTTDDKIGNGILVEVIANNVADAIIETISEMTPTTATIKFTDGTTPSINVEDINNVDSINITVKAPITSGETINVEIPRVNGSNEIDRPKLVDEIETTLKVDMLTTPRHPEDFSMSIDQFGFTIATLATTEVIITTENPTSIDSGFQETTTDSMNDFMSVSEFGFTIRAPGSDDSVDIDKDQSTPRLFPTTSQRLTVFDSSNDDSENTVIRPPSTEKVDIDNNIPGSDGRKGGIRPSTTLRSLETTQKLRKNPTLLPSIDISPPYTQISTTSTEPIIPSVSTESFEIQPGVEGFATLPKAIADNVVSFIEDSEEVPQTLLVEIESQKNLEKPEIKIEANSNNGVVKAKVNLEKDIRKPIEFQVPLKNVQGKIDKEELSEKISSLFVQTVSDKFDTTTATSSNPMIPDVSTESFEIKPGKEGVATIPKVIANNVVSLIDDVPKDLFQTLKVEIESKKNLKKPEIQLEANNNTGVVKATVNLLPNEIRKPIEFQVSLNNDKGEISKEELEEDIASAFVQAVSDKFETTTLATPISSILNGTNTTNLSDKITQSVINHVEKNGLKNTDDVKLVIVPKSEIFEPEIEVDGIENIEISLQVPNDEGDLIEEIINRIKVEKVPDSDIIDAEELNSAVKKLLDHPEKPDIDNEDLSQKITKSVEDHLIQNEASNPKDITLTISPESEIQDTKISVDGIDEIEVLVEVPSEENTKKKIVQKINVPQSTSSDSTDIPKLNTEVKLVLDDISKSADGSVLKSAIKHEDSSSTKSKDQLKNAIENLLVPKIRTPSVFLEDTTESNISIDLSEKVTKSVMDHLDQNGLKHPDDLTFIITPNTEISMPEIEVNGIEKIKVSVQVPKDEKNFNEETIMKIDVEKVQGTDIIDVQKLNSDLKELLLQIGSPPAIITNKTDAADLSEKITKSVIDHLDQNGLKHPEDLTLTIVPSSEILNSEIKVDGIDKIQVSIQVPDDKTELIEETNESIKVVKVPGTDTIDTQQLNADVKESLHKVKSDTSDILEKITKSLMDHIGQNDLKTPDDVTLILAPNTDVSEPKVEIDGIENIDVSLQIPNDGKELIEETIKKIDVVKVPGTNTIDVQKLNTDFKEQLDQSKELESSLTSIAEKKSKVKDLSEKVIKSVTDHLDQNNLKTPDDVLLIIAPDPEVSKPEIRVDGIEKIEVSIQVPQNKEESIEDDIKKIDVVKVPGTDTIDVQKLNTDLEEQLDQSKELEASLTSIAEKKSKDEDISEKVIKSVTDHLDQNNLKTPDDVLLIIATDPEVSKPEIKVDGIEKIEVSIQVPQNEDESIEEDIKKVNVVKVPGTDTLDTLQLDSDVKQILAHTEKPAAVLKDQLKNSDLSKEIAKSVIEHIDQQGKQPDDVTLIIAPNPNVSEAEIKVDGIENVEVAIQLPKNKNESNEKAVTKVHLPKVSKAETIDVKQLESDLKQTLDQSVKPSTILKDQDDVSNLSKEITKSVIDHLDRQEKQPDDATLIIETNSKLSEPEIKVAGVDNIEIAVQLPDVETESIKETVTKIDLAKVPEAEVIDVEQLEMDLKQTLDHPERKTSILKDQADAKDISEKITKSVTDHLNQNGLNNPDDLTLIIAPNDKISEPEINVAGIENIEVSLQIPDDEDESIKEEKIVKIDVVKLPNSDIIDDLQLNSDVEEILGPNMIPLPMIRSQADLDDLSKKITNSVKTHVDQNDLKNPDDITLVIKPNSDILEPNVNVDGIENVEVSVQIPNDRNEAIEETLLKIDVPKASDTEIIDVEQLNSNVKELLEHTEVRTSIPKKKFDMADFPQKVTKSLMDHLIQNDVTNPKDITIVIAPNSDIKKAKINVKGIDEIKVLVEVPDKENVLKMVTGKISVPKDLSTKSPDAPRLNAEVRGVLDSFVQQAKISDEEENLGKSPHLSWFFGTSEEEESVTETSKFPKDQISSTLPTIDSTDALETVVSSESLITDITGLDVTDGVIDDVTQSTLKDQALAGEQSTVSSFDKDKSVNVSTLVSSFTTESSTLPIRVGGPTKLSITTSFTTDSSTIGTKVDGVTQPPNEETITTSTELPDKILQTTQLPSRDNRLSSTKEATTSQRTTTDATTTTTESSFFGSGVLGRVRDLAIALVAGLIAQSVGFPFSPSPAKKDERGGEFVMVPTSRPPFVNAKDPYIRKQVKGGEGEFDGNTFSLTIPVKPNEVDELKKEEIRDNISTAVKEAFGSIDPVDNIQVIFADQSKEDGKIIINAPYTPPSQPPTTPRIVAISTQTDTRPKAPRLNDKGPIIDYDNLPSLRPDLSIPVPTTRRPEFTTQFRASDQLPAKIQNEADIFQPITPIRIPPEIGSDRILPVETTAKSTTSTSRKTVRPILTTSKTIKDTSTRKPLVPIREVPIPTRATTEEPVLPEYDINGIDTYDIPPTVFVPQVPRRDNEIDYPFIDSVNLDENQVYNDIRLNFLGGSSVNVVEARVEELANASPASTIGVATISSITVGIIALLGFGLIIFMALARRRRRKYDAATAASSANLTPTQSRTTFSGTPVMADTPSVSGGFGDDPLNTTGSSSIDPVVAIDGHQTIISSYNEFMSIPNDARNNIMHSLPSPQSSLEGGASSPSSPVPAATGNNNNPGPPPGEIPRTRDLIETSPFLFAPNQNVAGGNLHYP